MVRCRVSVGVCLLMMAGGCLSQESDTTLVAANPFDHTTVIRPPTGTSLAPAPVEVAAQVDLLGRKIIAANPQMGVQPLFSTIDAPKPEIFHYGTSEIVITEGLVKQCQTEGELAAVLCHELGKMVSEREALATPKARAPERQPPPEVRVGNDHGGSLGAPDQTYLAELAKYGKDRRREPAVPLPPPDPQRLARAYLKNASYSERELDQVTSLLREAAGNNTFEKQFTSPAPTRSWGP